ncbi:WD40 repeat domain-containing protein [Aliterella atlantica]|uniref:WD40 repeat-containing protein n=1 Tax=Aliterella atlantica CENA595 TaxID=1618023 RepID=A0A0D8ZNJ8_9CYAN|nr:WD40 repeat-containing protein [Aliterella atlantica CENA595]
MKSSTTNSPQFDLHWRGTLADYVTAIAWSPQGKVLAISSAAGEVMLWRDLAPAESNWSLLPLQMAENQSLDCLAFSQDGQYLAAGGQAGQVKIWRLREETRTYRCKPFHTIENAPAWVDKLAWNPVSNQLAFSLGRYVQVWDADMGEVVATLNFDNSSVLDLHWSPDGQYLAIAGYQGAKIWNSQDWDDDPHVVVVPSASLAVSWSPDGKYLACGNMDRTIAVIEWHNSIASKSDRPNQNFFPWVMRGFPGKIRQLAWSQPQKLGTSLLAASSVEGIVVWERADESIGWESRLLQQHSGVIQALAFQPHSLLLASASEDGWVCLWQKAKKLAQILPGAPNGFSCLAWHPQGRQLAAGGQSGEVLIWAQGMRGQGFSRH